MGALDARQPQLAVHRRRCAAAAYAAFVAVSLLGGSVDRGRRHEYNKKKRHVKLRLYPAAFILDARAREARRPMGVSLIKLSLIHTCRRCDWV